MNDEELDQLTKNFEKLEKSFEEIHNQYERRNVISQKTLELVFVV